MPAIIGDDLAQTNSEILYNPLMCQNIDAVFSSSMVLGCCSTRFVCNIVAQKRVACVLIRRIWWPIEAHSSGLWVLQKQNAVPKVFH
ncbi:hypothetical protein TNCT_621451 [Trichonephila clavata]|uniref:Uncharacterized protein n=1 Tax=Trichonephila clavata TaxID=2740835 RepID=A0A8X6LTQ6_TRICU|nr:hypothetical protein TNCT_621451 [Trichonephila clavata]